MARSEPFFLQQVRIPAQMMSRTPRVAPGWSSLGGAPIPLHFPHGRFQKHGSWFQVGEGTPTAAPTVPCTFVPESSLGHRVWSCVVHE